MKLDYTLTAIDQDGNMVLDHAVTAEQVIVILAEALKVPKDPVTAGTVLIITPPVAEKKAVKQMKEEVSKWRKSASADVNPSKYHDLHDRVVKWHAKGWTNSQIAEKCGVTPQAVGKHLSKAGLSPNKKEKHEIVKEAMDSTRTGRGTNNCSLCGKSGHKKSKCPDGNHHGELRKEFREESSLSPELQERIKDMRDQDLTTSEIAKNLSAELHLDEGALRNEVEKVMSRSSDKYRAPQPENFADVKGRALSAEEFSDLHIAMLDKEFMSGSYALSHRLSPREVNLAVISASYQEYIDKGVQI